MKASNSKNQNSLYLSKSYHDGWEKALCNFMREQEMEFLRIKLQQIRELMEGSYQKNDY
ncbi:hypothetical protein [Flexithrix dorotheae]|uniref:hypothetical protein n=1 Tax=Flexithrix dorotheae TaxID=70993 RepID=UPI00036BDBB2|nr:hypothetical protein [Flexithrix dorotheae]